MRDDTAISSAGPKALQKEEGAGKGKKLSTKILCTQFEAHEHNTFMVSGNNYNL